MIQAINECDFSTAFHKMGRGEQFTYEGLKALYEYLEQLGDDIGEQIELDVIALCCEYSEYENLDEFQKDYSREFQSIEELQQATQVIMIDDTSFIIQQF